MGNLYFNFMGMINIIFALQFVLGALVISSILIYIILKAIEKLGEIIYTRTNMYAWLFSFRNRMSDEDRQTVINLYRKYRYK